MTQPPSPTPKTPARRSIVTVTDVTKTFATRDGGELPVLEGINLEVKPGEIVALLGKSGSGSKHRGWSPRSAANGPSRRST